MFDAIRGHGRWAFRDIHAIANHVGVPWDLVAPAYGRIALGID